MNRGLMKVADTMFTPEKGARANVKHLLLVISDGNQNEVQPSAYPDEKSLEDAASMVKEKGLQKFYIV